MRRRHLFAVAGGILATVVMSGMTSSATAGCPDEPDYPHRTSLTVGDLVFHLASDAASYPTGQTVRLLFSVENAGTGTVLIANPCGCTPLESFAIVGRDCPVPPPAGCPILFWPETHFFFGTNVILGPGQCYSRHRAWDGASNVAAPPGPYDLVAGMSGSDTPGFFLPVEGVRLPFEIYDETVATRVASWGRVKVIYR